MSFFDPNKKYSAFILTAALFIYLSVVIWLLFFEVGDTERELYFTAREIHLVPLESTYHSLHFALSNNYEPVHKKHQWYITIRNIIGNLLLFYPWGILAPLTLKGLNSFKNLILTTLIISLFAEVVQYFFIVGVADIDDILLNVLGATMGFYTLRWFNKTIFS